MKKREEKRDIAVSVSKRQNKVGCQIEKLEVAGRRFAVSASQKSLDASKWSIRNPEKNRKGKNKRKDQAQEEMKKKRKNAS